MFPTTTGLTAPYCFCFTGFIATPEFRFLGYIPFALLPLGILAYEVRKIYTADEGENRKDLCKD